MIVLERQSLINLVQGTVISTGEALIIGISSHGGSGKFIFAHLLSSEIPGSVVIGVD